MVRVEELPRLRLGLDDVQHGGDNYGTPTLAWMTCSMALDDHATSRRWELNTW